MTTDKDYAVTQIKADVPILQRGIAQLNKPAHLLVFESSGKSKVKCFITIEKPEFEGQFVHVKGIYSEVSEEEISNSFTEILTTAGKDSIIEMYFPLHRISSIKNLVFRANKK